MAFKIELRPHIAQQRIDIGGKEHVIDVDHKQCYVLVDGKQVGWYCGLKDQPNKFLAFILPLPDAVQAEIAAEVAKLTGGVQKYAAPPPDEHEVVHDDE